MTPKEAAEEIKRKISGAYHERKDYPPYELMAWDDRAKFYQYVFKLIDEWAESKEIVSKGAN